MEINSVKDAFDRVTKKRKLSSSRSQEITEQIGAEIEAALSTMQSIDEAFNSHGLMLGELKAKLKEITPLSWIVAAEKEVNVALSKYLTLVEKSFNSCISKAYRDVEFDVHTVNHIIASHFCREGQFDTGDCFVNEARESEAEAAKSSFFEMYQILDSMKSRNLEPALKWVANKREELKQNGSDIEFKLQRLQFLEILQNRGRDEALKYAKTHLAPLATSHMVESQKLMGCLLWSGRLDKSPYLELLSPVHWDNLSEEFTRHFCKLIGQSYGSPLSVTIAAGLQALPTLLKLANVMALKKQEWESVKHLPVPMDLDREFQFHSVFVCPVSREQASEENPAMLLSCGHVLCRQSITKLAKYNSPRPFKCPYCPLLIEGNQCRQLYF